MNLIGHKKTGRMRRQSSIVVGFLNQILRSSALIVKPDELIDRTIHIGHKHAILILLGREKLVLHDIFRFLFVVWVFSTTERKESVRLAPTVGLIPKFALFVGVRVRRWLPRGCSQFLQEARGFTRHYDEPALEFLVGLHCFPAMETGISPGEKGCHTTRQRLKHILQMPPNLFSCWPITVAQFAPPRTPWFLSETTGSADNFSSPYSWDCSFYALPFYGLDLPGDAGVQGRPKSYRALGTGSPVLRPSLSFRLTL